MAVMHTDEAGWRAPVGNEISQANITGIPEAHAKAVKAVAEFGTTVVTEAGNLSRFVGRILGTIPEDAVGLVIGDPLHFVRAAIAQKYDARLSDILRRRGVTQTEPVSPSVAIPLVRAAYDESRPELQELWANLMASAMDPNRTGWVRLSFIETLKQFDPLDARVLKERAEASGELAPNAVVFISQRCETSTEEIQISVENLLRLGCVAVPGIQANFVSSPYGRGLLRACSS